MCWPPDAAVSQETIANNGSLKKEAVANQKGASRSFNNMTKNLITIKLNGENKFV